MRTWIAGLALAAIPTLAPAEALTVYKYVDGAGRVTYTNQKPKQGEDFDTLEVEYDGPAAAATRPPAPPAPATAKPSRRNAAAEQVASLEVLAFPSLRLAAAGLEPPLRLRRKAPAAPFALRLDTELRLAP